MAVEPEVRVQAGPIDLAAEIAGIEGGGSAGALVTFTGSCRDEGGRLEALELEHYPGMAEAEIARMAAEAVRRWDLLAATAVHRYGRVSPGETIVFVACASVHRGPAFEAAQFLMDYMKTRAPFWKREHLTDGTVGGWVEAKDTDDAATERWHHVL